MLHDRRDDGFLLSGDVGLLDREVVHRWLSTDSYWAAGRDRATMDQAISGSHPVGVYLDPARQEPHQQDPDRQDPDQQDPDQQHPEQQHPEQQHPERRDPERQGNGSARGPVQGELAVGPLNGAAGRQGREVGEPDRARQVAFARVVTDGAVFAYLCDVYVDPEFRGRGLGRWMVAALRDELRRLGLKRFLLVTLDAQGVYAPLGFASVDPALWMLCELQQPQNEAPADQRPLTDAPAAQKP